jgi:hypothetical protein
VLKFYFAGTINEKREGSGAGSVPLAKGSRSGRSKKHADLADPVPDPDPQHCLPCSDADEEARRNPPQGEQTLLLLVHQLPRHNYWVPYA